MYKMHPTMKRALIFFHTDKFFYNMTRDELETVKLKRGLEAIFEPADSIPRKEMPLEGAIDGNRTYVTVEKEFGQVRRKLG